MTDLNYLNNWRYKEKRKEKSEEKVHDEFQNEKQNKDKRLEFDPFHYLKSEKANSCRIDLGPKKSKEEKPVVIIIAAAQPEPEFDKSEELIDHTIIKDDPMRNEEKRDVSLSEE